MASGVSTRRDAAASKAVRRLDMCGDGARPHFASALHLDESRRLGVHRVDAFVWPTALAGEEGDEGGGDSSRGRILSSHIPTIEKDVSRVIYGTLFLHTFETDDECFTLLDSVWASGCNAFDCAAI